MDNTTKNSLKIKWTNICNLYLRRFCDKHAYCYEPDTWICGNPGTIVNVGDMFVNMDDIRYDIDNNISEEMFENWYWRSLEIYELVGEKYMNYQSYCEGCPDYWTEDKLASIRAAKQRVIDARDALEREIENHKQSRKDF